MKIQHTLHLDFRRRNVNDLIPFESPVENSNNKKGLGFYKIVITQLIYYDNPNDLVTRFVSI